MALLCRKYFSVRRTPDGGRAAWGRGDEDDDAPTTAPSLCAVPLALLCIRRRPAARPVDGRPSPRPANSPPHLEAGRATPRRRRMATTSPNGDCQFVASSAHFLPGPSRSCDELNDGQPASQPPDIIILFVPQNLSSSSLTPVNSNCQHACADPTKAPSSMDSHRPLSFLSLSILILFVSNLDTPNDMAGQTRLLVFVCESDTCCRLG